MSRFYDLLKEASRSAGSNGISEAHSTSMDVAAAAVPAPAVQAETVEAVSPQPVPECREPAPAEPQAAPVNGTVEAPTSANGGNRLQGQKVETPRPTRSGVVLKLDAATRVLPNITKSVVVEQYGKLRTKLLQEQGVRPFRTLAITSPGPQEGKTVTAINLALSFAVLPNFRVLIVDGDIRRGCIGEYFGVHDTPGLSNVLDGSARLQDVILSCEEHRLDVLPRGNSENSPAELILFDRVAGPFRHMGQLYDIVIIDSPPVNLIADAQIIASECDASLVVTRAFITKRKALERAMQDLGSTRVIGTVLNSGTRAQVYSRYGGYY